MSALNDKINSYALNRGIEFNEAFTTTPIRTGTSPLAPAWTAPTTKPTFISTDGPLGGSGCWEIAQTTLSGTNAYFRAASSSTTELSSLSDLDYSVGLWFNYKLLPAGTGTGSCSILNISSVQGGFQLFINGSDHTTNPSKLYLSLGTGSLTTLDPAIIQDTWNYVAITRTGTGTNNYKIYLNGTLIGTTTNSGTSLPNTISFGSAGTTSSALATLRVSNFYIAPTSEINETQIAEIWTAGSTSGSTDVTITETPATASALQVLPTVSRDTNNLATPATASALMTEPTIVVSQQGDHTQITTSFIGSAEFPQNWTVLTSINKNVVITETLNASVELLDNITVITNKDESFSAEEFVASATFVKPFLAEQPFIASATMPGGTAVVQASYFNLVKSLNPVFYYNFRENTMNNYGSWNISSYSVGSTVTKNQTSPGDLLQIDNGKSWKFTGTYFNAPNEIEIVPQSGQNYIPQTYNSYAPPLNGNPIIDLIRSRSYSLEYWFTTNSINNGVGLRVGNIDIRFKNGKMGYDIYATLPAWSNTQIGVPGPAYDRYDYESVSMLLLNDWNHIVVNVSPVEDSSDGENVQFWVNSSLVSSVRYTMDYTRLSDPNFTKWFQLTSTSNPGLTVATSQSTPFQPTTEPGKRGFWTNFENTTPAQVFFDEVAVYDQPLTSSQIIDHYSFIYNQSPDRTIAPIPLTAEAESGDHAVLAISNANIVETPVTASSLFVNPTVLTVKNLSISATPLTASALNTDVTVYYGWTIYADFAIATAEAKEGFALNTTYYDYVIANINPYRYVTFDTATPLADFGIDNDYSVTSTTVGGTIVNPDLGITGKSAKTAGTSYITDGVILNESEWNDSWGTGANSYHSAFWFQRALDDASTTGLRVLWNLNGYKDNQHAILYQYQGKLHMQVNNGSGTFVQQDTNALDLFDYQRHFIVIEHTHGGGGNNTIKLYVDAVLKFTFNFNSVTLTTTNAASADSGPNNEANNRARLSVGCLITPFNSTALPVAPANTKLIIDEIYWDKNTITSTMVTNLYNVMPDKTNANTVADILIASVETVMPAISTTVNFIAAPATASSEFANPSLFIVRLVSFNANTMNASALMMPAIALAPINITADIFVATAIFNNVGVIISIPAQPMIASVQLVNRRDPLLGTSVEYGISVTTNGITYKLREFSPYIKYLRIVARNQKIYKDMEIL